MDSLTVSLTSNASDPLELNCSTSPMPACMSELWHGLCL